MKKTTWSDRFQCAKQKCRLHRWLKLIIVECLPCEKSNRRESDPVIAVLNNVIGQLGAVD